jgi:hypothetical protein
LRRLSLVAGVALIALAFATATRVTDTREGLVAEVITLLGGMAGVGLLIYAFTARRRRGRPQVDPTPKSSVTGGRRSLRDLAFGAGGIVLGVVLLTGLVFSGGPLWASLGLALLLPMLAGSIYLCVRFLRSAP